MEKQDSNSESRTKVVVGSKVDEIVKTALERLAAKDDRSVSYIIERCLREHPAVIGELAVLEAGEAEAV